MFKYFQCWSGIALSICLEIKSEYIVSGNNSKSNLFVYVVIRQSLIVITSYSDGKLSLLKFVSSEIHTSKYFV